MTVTKCGNGEIGPIIAWRKSNMVESCDEKNYCSIEYACLEGKYSGGTLTTKHTQIKGLYFDTVKWEYLFSEHKKGLTDPRFDALFVPYTIESYISKLSALGVYPTGVDSVLHKIPFTIELHPSFPNAFFSYDDYSLMFGGVFDQCSFAADAEPIKHELDHMLAYSTNPQAGLFMSDIEGAAMHEAFADAGGVIDSGDPEVGESLPVCLGMSSTLSRDKGIRDVSSKQCQLFYDEECHARSEMYSTPIWFLYKKLVNRMQGADAEEKDKKAREVMLIVIHNAFEFVRPASKPPEFVKAMYNAFIDVKNRPEFAAKYEFDLDGFVKDLVHEAKASGIIGSKDAAALKEALTLFPVVNSDAEAISKYTTEKVKFELAYTRGRQRFYRQINNGFAMEGKGLKFIDTMNGTQLVDMRWIPDEKLNDKPGMPAAKAWQMLLGEKARVEVQASIDLNVKKGNVDKRAALEFAQKFRSVRGMRMPQPKLVFIAGRTNLQYKFTVKGMADCYVDSVTGSVELSRRSFY